MTYPLAGLNIQPLKANLTFIMTKWYVWLGWIAWKSANFTCRQSLRKRGSRILNFSSLSTDLLRKSMILLGQKTFPFLIPILSCTALWTTKGKPGVGTTMYATLLEFCSGWKTVPLSLNISKLKVNFTQPISVSMITSWTWFSVLLLFF